MANPEHLEILKQGVQVWNEWRKRNLKIPADLSSADLHGVSLSRAYLLRTNLCNADLSNTQLNGACLSNAELREANLRSANLSGADLHSADLRGADLTGAFLDSANLSWAKVDNAVLRVDLLETVIASVDLSRALGLEKCQHWGPSTLDHRTLEKSGSLPREFLRGVGLPDTFIDYIPSLFGSGIEFFSGFLSHSSADKDFASHLHDKLQGKGVRCWLDTHQIKPGDKIMHAIDEGIRIWDKVVLCCSETSLESWWVDDEMERILRKERSLRDQHGPGISTLIPVDLDGYVFDKECKSPFQDQILARNVADFTGWKNHDKFEVALAGLVDALRSDDGATPPAPEPKLKPE